MLTQRLASLAAAASMLVLAACSSDDGGGAALTTTSAATTTASQSSSTTTPATTAGPTTTAAATPGTTAPPPAGDAFYTPPDPLPPGRPGDLLWSRPFNGPAGTQSYEILYRSTTATGDPVAVSGVVIAPAGEGGAPRPIVAWAHGTTGMGDQCAIGRAFAAGKAPDAVLATLAIGKGWVFVASDYQGLGTPGDHTYLVGQAEGRNVLDSIRAAQRLPGLGTSEKSAGLVWGHSQGGGAAWFAAELAPTYAADANVKGSAAGAPAGDPGLLLSITSGGRNAGYGLMVAVGFMAAYPDLPGDLLTAGAKGEPLTLARTGCGGDIVAGLAGRSDLYTRQPASDPAWKKALDANRAGGIRTDVPVLVYHGEADELLPAATSKSLYDAACATGSPVERRTYPGGTHVGVIADALVDITAFFDARLAGAAFSGCR
ncbi:MAG TPA: alpha/beta hydrolase [Acidimicrobiales bacterium]